MNIRCCRCQVDKDSAEFHKADLYCKPCRREYRREWLTRHPGYAAKASKAWYAANPEKMREKHRIATEKKKARFHSDPAYADAVRAKDRAKYARKMAARGPVDNMFDGNLANGTPRKKFRSAIRLELLQKQRFRCANCKKFLYDGHHVDHIIPRAKGGSHEKGNLQLLCPKCNRVKSCADPIVFAQENGRLI